MPNSNNDELTFAARERFLDVEANAAAQATSIATLETRVTNLEEAAGIVYDASTGGETEEASPETPSEGEATEAGEEPSEEETTTTPTHSRRR